MDYELKPCPFCGSQPEAYRNHEGGLKIKCANWSITSPNCKVTVYVEGLRSTSDDEVIAAWNARQDGGRGTNF